MLKCKIKCKDDSFSVSDLQQAETFDLFSQLEVEFTGTAPEGRASLTYTGTELRSDAFRCDKSRDLSNGDTITVSVSDSNVELLAKQLGKVPESLEKQYTVQGLNSYVTKASEIDETALAEMQKQASDEYISHAAQWKEDKKLENLSYLEIIYSPPKMEPEIICIWFIKPALEIIMLTASRLMIRSMKFTGIQDLRILW